MAIKSITILVWFQSGSNQLAKSIFAIKHFQHEKVNGSFRNKFTT